MENKEYNKYESALRETIRMLYFYMDEDELKKRTDYVAGKQIAYIEAFSALQYALNSNDIPLDEFDIDFDVDNMF